MQGIWFVSAVALLAGCANAETLTVHQLKQSWKRYDGKVVEIRGQIDACTRPANCLICPEEMTSRSFDVYRCLSIVFSEQRDPEFWHANFPLEYRKDEIYRLTVVTVRARLNSECLWDESGEPAGNAICTDGPANLDDAAVLEVRARLTEATGLIDPPPLPITPTSGSDEEGMRAEFKLSMGHWGDFKLAVFVVQLDAAAVHNKEAGYPSVPDGVACICMEDTCDGRWPSGWFEGMAGPGNPYHCWGMEKTAQGWRVLPGF